MSIRNKVFEALDNSVHNTSLAEVLLNNNIPEELKNMTTGFESIKDEYLIKYINEWKEQYLRKH